MPLQTRFRPPASADESPSEVVFLSKAPKHCRAALENLLFFNPRQFRARQGILSSLERYGHPCVEDTADGLCVRVGTYEAQTLFAFDRLRLNGDPVGLVVFLRTDWTEIGIVHVTVHPDYALQGRRTGLGLGFVLVEKVKEIALRIVGVERVSFVYRNEVVLRV